MNKHGKFLATGAGLAAGVYAAYAGLTWSRYGHVPPPDPDEADDLLDRFMPVYEVAERHHRHVAAAAAVTLAIAGDIDAFDLPVVRAVFRGRELILGASAANRRPLRGLLDEAQSLGWGVLATVPDREIVMGAVTRPWEANVTFRTLPADAFRGFDEADYVKIAWTLRADPDGRDASVLRTETRAIATDAGARAKFRRYWSLLSPGIVLIRRVIVDAVKAQAEAAAVPIVLEESAARERQ
jgi:hypothetical protein